MDEVQAHVWVSGRVQGVFFRHNTQREATRRKLKGWVRNLYDGRVEAIFKGERESVEEMIRWCNQGPPGAWVKEVEVVWEDPDPRLIDFRILY